ncbi:MAG TPA: hypothetical protein VIC85_08320 [Ktedonobacterales bacterium]
MAVPRLILSVARRVEAADAARAGLAASRLSGYFRENPEVRVRRAGRGHGGRFSGEAQ